MKWLRYCVAMLSFILFSPASHAGQDPIGWSVTGVIPAQSVANLLYPTPVVYTFINNMPFPMVTPLYIKIEASPAAEFPMLPPGPGGDNCSGKLLTAAGTSPATNTCTVTIGFAPASIGTKTLQVFEEYGRNVVPLPKLTSNTTSGPNPLLTATVTIPLPASMAAGSSAPFQFTYQNNNNGTVQNVVSPTTNITINPNPGGSGSLSALSTTCTAPTNLAPGASCVVKGTFTAGIQGNYTVNDFVSFTGSSGATVTASLSTSTNVPIAGAVTTPLPNSMGAGEQQPVLFTFTNGSTQAITPSSVTFSPTGGTAALATPTSDTCSGQSIPAGGSCTVSIIFSTLTPQAYSVFATLTYPGGSVNTPVTPSTPQVSAVHVTGMVTNALPTTMNNGDVSHIVFTYTNPDNGLIYGVTAPSHVDVGGTFVPDTPAAGTCGQSSTIPAFGTCTYSGNFTAGPLGPYSVTATFNYAGGSNVVPVTTSAVSPSFIGSVTQALPSPTMGAGEQQPFAFSFLNTTGAPITPTSLNITTTGGTEVQTNNCNLPVAGGASCTVTGTFSSGVPNATAGSYSVTAVLNFPGGSTVPVTTSSSGPMLLVQGMITNGFPAYSPPSTMGTGEQHSVTFTYMNTGTGTAYFVTDPKGNTSLMPSTNGSCVGGVTGTCVAGTLAAGSSCTVICNFEAFQPVDSSTVTSLISSTFTYAGGTTTLLATSAPTSRNVVAGALVPFPTATKNTLSYPFTITFTNTGTSPVLGGTTNPVLTISPGPQTVLTNPTNTPATSPTPSANCSAGSLPAGQSCSVSGTYTPTVASTTFTFNAFWSYDGGTVSQPQVTSTNTFARKFTIKNYCSKDVWFSFNGAPVRKGCSDKHPCDKGSVCNKEADGGKGVCYWANPIPSKGGLHLGPMTELNPTSVEVLVPDLDKKNATIWSGSIAGRTGCKGSNCETADCNSNGGDKACPPGNPFTLPATTAEFTLNRTTEDKYSIQASHGVNLSLSIGPTNPDKTTPAYNGNNPYYCATPGSADASRIFKSCSWMLKPPAYPNASSAVNYVWVAPGKGGVCSANACPGNEVCGLSFSGGKFAKVCGIQKGYWTASQACLLHAVDASAYFDCKTAMTQQPAGEALQALNACTNGTAQTPADQAQACAGAGNKEMAAMVQWIKSACPSASVFNGDTANSFACKTNEPETKENAKSETKMNVTEYTIAFCPEMAPGSPFRNIRGTTSNP